MPLVTLCYTLKKMLTALRALGQCLGMSDQVGSLSCEDITVKQSDGSLPTSCATIAPSPAET